MFTKLVKNSTLLFSNLLFPIRDIQYLFTCQMPGALFKALSPNRVSPLNLRPATNLNLLTQQHGHLVPQSLHLWWYSPPPINYPLPWPQMNLSSSGVTWTSELKFKYITPWLPPSFCSPASLSQILPQYLLIHWIEVFSPNYSRKNIS